MSSGQEWLTGRFSFVEVRFEHSDAVRFEDELVEVFEYPREGKREVEEAPATDVLHVDGIAHESHHVDAEGKRELLEETVGRLRGHAGAACEYLR